MFLFEGEELQEYQNQGYEGYEEEALVGLLTISTEQPETLSVGQGSAFNTQLWGVLLAVAFLVALAYFAVRITGRGKGARNSRNLKIVEALGVSPQSTVQLIQAGDKYFLIGVSRQGITALGEVDADAINTEEVTSSLPEISFDKYLARFTKKKDEPPKES